jgi:hypothetical protein
MLVALGIIGLALFHWIASASATVGRFPPHIRDSDLVDSSFIAVDIEGKCHELYDSEEAGDADSACSWCECSAVPSPCFEITGMDKLPHGVFKCSKESDLFILLQDHQFIEVATQELHLNKLEINPEKLMCFLQQQDKDTCLHHASLHCSWCTIEEEGQEAEGCLPGFIAKSFLEKHAVMECSPSLTQSSVNAEETFPNLHVVLRHDDAIPPPLLTASSTSVQQSIFLFDSRIKLSLEDDVVDPLFYNPKCPKSLAGHVSLKGSVCLDAHRL